MPDVQNTTVQQSAEGQASGRGRFLGRRGPKDIPNDYHPTDKNPQEGLSVDPLDNAKKAWDAAKRAINYFEASAETPPRYSVKMAQHGMTTGDTVKRVGADNEGKFTWTAAEQINLMRGNDAILTCSKQFYNESLDIEDLPSMTSGTPSMMNKYTVFSLAKISAKSGALFFGGQYDYSLMYDYVNTGEFKDYHVNKTNFERGSTELQSYESRNPTIDNIIKVSRSMDSDGMVNYFPYSYQDFVYCKYYGKVPNNRLITLRRYPIPVYDNAMSTDNNPLVPVAQAVTYFGEGTDNKLNDVMKFTYGLKWKPAKSEVQEVDGNERGLGSVFGAIGGGKMTSVVGAVSATLRGVNQPGSDQNQRWNGQGEKLNNWAKKAYGNNGPYWNEVFGPVNVIDQSTMRDRGMEFQQSIKLKFSYSLRAFDGINPKVAMLDIISNMLTLTYNNAKFWGGCMRYFPNYKDEVEMLGDYAKFYSGDYSGYFKSVKDEVTAWGSRAMGVFNNILASVKGQGSFMDKMKAIGSALGGMVEGAAAMALGRLSAASRPEMLSIRTLLSGDPTGEWHLTVGNPLDPIARMGNMHVYKTSFSCSEELGADDFPTEIYFEVELKPGMPRDTGSIESMFNLGFGKMTYQPYTELPSEMGTFGAHSVPDQQKEIEKKKDFARMERRASTQELAEFFLQNGEARKTYQRIQSRLNVEWGTDYANSKQLVFLMSKTRMRF